MSEAQTAFNVPGVAVAVVRDDKVTYLKGFGVREIGSDKAVTPDTIFPIASCTKAFTATAIARLVDEGKMTWDDPVRKHLAYFHMSDPFADREVTIRDLLCHRTGLPRHDAVWLQPWSREEVIRHVAFLPPDQPFRSRYEYNNLLYVVAGAAAGKAVGTTWEEIVQQRLFDPLGMKTANCTVLATKKAADHATPHLRKEDGSIEVIPFEDDDVSSGPCGSINASARDMSRWLRFQLAEGVIDGHRLLSANQFRETHRPQVVVDTRERFEPLPPELTTQTCYALGWRTVDYRGHSLVLHGGATDGFMAMTLLVPKSRLGIVVLSNLSDVSFRWAAALGLIDSLLNRPHRDWSTRFLNHDREKRERDEREWQQLTAARRLGTLPSHALEAFAGRFENAGYGPLAIRREKDGLHLAFSHFHYALRHYHFDTYQIAEYPNLATELGSNGLIVFRLGVAGEVAGMEFLGQEFRKVQ